MKKPKIEPNIQCTYCDYKWNTTSKRKYMTCPSCNSKTLNPLWITANNVKLYRIWSFDSNDRSEIARAIAANFETVQDYLLKEFIKPEFRNEVEITDYGLQWNSNTPKECLEYADPETYEYETKEELTQAFNNDEINLCEFCEGCTAGFQIEELEKPTGLHFGETFEFKTIFGTNDFYDLTGKRHTKAKDHNPLLSKAWKKDSETGIAALILSTVQEKPELKKGFDPELLRKSQEKTEGLEDEEK